MRRDHCNIFDTIDTVSCYWAGFLAADGSLRPQNERILDWLYLDSTQSTRLDRKYKKYREIA